ncbi:MAG: hypothetical protein AABX49_02685 [Nanoarchaeota archaeon]
MKKWASSIIFLSLLILYSTSVYSQESTVVFNGTIPELTIKTGVNKEVVNLSEYFSSNNTLTYKYKAGVEGIEGLIIEIGSDGRAKIEASSRGSRSVIFIADDDTTAVQSNDVKIKVSGDAIAEISFSPNTDTVTLEDGKSQTFAVSGNKSVEWYVDNIKINHTEKTYSFNGEVGSHTVKAVVDGSEKVWNASVTAVLASPPVQEIESAPQGPVCGNNIKESEENCSTCPADVKCSASTKCSNGVCVPAKQKGKLILLLGLLSASIVFIVMIVILLRKKGIRVGVLNAKVFDKIKNLFGKKNIEKEQVKIEEEKAEKIDEVDLNPLVIYFKSNLGKYKKEELMNQALGQGWTQDQVSKALDKIESLEEEYDKFGKDKEIVEGK